MFLSNPGLVPIVNRPDFWWLDGPLVWTDGPSRIIIPAGFITDDASIPKFLDWVPCLDRQGLSRRPGLLHDGIYALGRSIGKEAADATLRNACRAEGMSAFCSGVIYEFVRFFGDAAWNKDANEASVAFIGEESAALKAAAGSTIYGVAP